MTGFLFYNEWVFRKQPWVVLVMTTQSSQKKGRSRTKNRPWDKCLFAFVALACVVSMTFVVFGTSPVTADAAGNKQAGAMKVISAVLGSDQASNAAPVDSSETVADDATPLAAPGTTFGSEANVGATLSWSHWIMVFGAAATLAYGVSVVYRRRKEVHGMDDFERQVTD